MAQQRAARTGRRRQHDSGIGGQAVLEGIMMRNHDLAAVAVRKPDQEIEIEIDEHHGFLEGTVWNRIPVVRGIFAFLDSLVLGIRSMNFSARFYDEAGTPAGVDPERQRRQENLLAGLSGLLGAVLAVGLFVLLPYYLTGLVEGYIRSRAFLSLLEGLIRIAIVVAYLLVISRMKDMRRLYQYHGAEHKCINCIERGKPLTVNYVRDSSRFHRRCGTSFIFLVLLVSVVLFFFVQVNSRSLRLLLRFVLIPVVAGISYELIHWAGRSDSALAKVVSAPGLWLQRITTSEPDESMIQVGIASVEAVFDWRAYLADEFGWNREELDEY